MNATRTGATILIMVLFAAIYALAVAHGEEPLALELDQARLIHMPSGTHTLVIGNPLIADASVQAHDLVILTGKSFGRTNIVFTDVHGRVILERVVIVRSASGIVTVMRGSARQSYACLPACEPIPALGDAQVTFEPELKQIGERNGAIGAANMGAKP